LFLWHLTGIDPLFLRAYARGPCRTHHETLVRGWYGFGEGAFMAMGNITISNIIHSASVQLACAGVDDPAGNTCFLVGHALGLAQNKVEDHLDLVLSEKEMSTIASLIDRRAKRETLNRITGKTKFCDLYFATNEATLEPRPNSETIVRAIVKRVKRFSWFLGRRKSLRVLDLGTGSGCILLSFLHALPCATGLGIDLAPRAIEQARENARHLDLDARCAFQLNNWADGIEEQFDIVAFNPPYIPTADIPKLMPAVRNFDPIGALDGGEDGLDPYRTVIPYLPKLLKKDGLAGIEFGLGQTESIGRFLKDAGYRDVRLYSDDSVFIVRQM
jgi:release factor glutamine methyltransferase